MQALTATMKTRGSFQVLGEGKAKSGCGLGRLPFLATDARDSLFGFAVLQSCGRSCGLSDSTHTAYSLPVT